jgi:hypothetical protein
MWASQAKKTKQDKSSSGKSRASTVPDLTVPLSFACRFLQLGTRIQMRMQITVRVPIHRGKKAPTRKQVTTPEHQLSKGLSPFLRHLSQIMFARLLCFTCSLQCAAIAQQGERQTEDRAGVSPLHFLVGFLTHVQQLRAFLCRSKHLA